MHTKGAGGGATLGGTQCSAGWSEIRAHAFGDSEQLAEPEAIGAIALTLRDHGGVAARATIQKALALDEIALEMAHYLAAEGAIRRDDLIADIVKIIEMKTNYIFVKHLGETRIPAFTMMAHDRMV